MAGYLAGELILLVSLIWFEQQLPDVCVWIPLLVMFKWYGKVMMGWGGGGREVPPPIIPRTFTFQGELGVQAEYRCKLE